MNAVKHWREMSVIEWESLLDRNDFQIRKSYVSYRTVNHMELPGRISSMYEIRKKTTGERFDYARSYEDACDRVWDVVASREVN